MLQDINTTTQLELPIQPPPANTLKEVMSHFLAAYRAAQASNRIKYMQDHKWHVHPATWLRWGLIIMENTQHPDTDPISTILGISVKCDESMPEGHVELRSDVV
jgi:hypothetical protein